MRISSGHRRTVDHTALTNLDGDLVMPKAGTDIETHNRCGGWFAWIIAAGQVPDFMRQAISDL